MIHFSKPRELYRTKRELQCMWTFKKSFRRSEGSQDGTKIVTKGSDTIINACNYLTKWDGEKGMESKLKAKGTVHKNCTLVDKVVPQRATC